MPCEWKVHEKRKEYVRRHDEEERGRRGMIAGGRVAVKALRQESSPGPAACSVQVLTIVALSLPTDFFSLCRNCHSKSEKREGEKANKLRRPVPVNFHSEGRAGVRQGACPRLSPVPPLFSSSGTRSGNNLPPAGSRVAGVALSLSSDSASLSPLIVRWTVGYEIGL